MARTFVAEALEYLDRARIESDAREYMTLTTRTDDCGSALRCFYHLGHLSESADELSKAAERG